MIKITKHYVYEEAGCCSACGRTLGTDKYEVARVIQMDKRNLLLCHKCTFALNRILTNHLKHG